MTSSDEYKHVSLALLNAFQVITEEHMMMAEAMRYQSKIQADAQAYLPQARQATAAVFDPLRHALESGSGIGPALEELLKLPR